MIDKREIQLVLEAALSRGGDFAEIYFEEKDEFSIKHSANGVNGITGVSVLGAGVYLLSGMRSVYVYTNDTCFHSLMETAKRAAFMLNEHKTRDKKDFVFQMKHYKSPNRVQYFPKDIHVRDKIEVIKRADISARQSDRALKSLNVDYFDYDQRKTIANSEGLYVSDRRVTSRLRFSAVVERNGLMLSEWGDYTKPSGFEAFTETDAYLDFAKEFVIDLSSALDGVAVPSSTVPVVLEAGSCGTLWHEACGHMLEASAITENRSDFCDKLGQQVASEKVTLVDDGTLEGLYGSSAIDDEGFKTQKNVLIESGILKGYLCDRMGARRLKMAPTASGRRQGYAYAPTSRMTNTYLAEGHDDDDEIISSVENGLYVKRLGGGNSGRSFSIAVTEGYLIKKGKISDRVKGLSINGRGIDIIKNVDRVGKKLITDSGGFCGASSGLCQVTSFQPRIRIANMTVGSE
ncbi:TldD/PmbA family protein [Fusibacter ferrireducens]|uniref:TldD/PmbA family protein n=1 Tax=Fusibacter ferrireducens TaxID=2785058 RepID=A0ABR9ZTG6_9FIRM|nr:TldD/PmbA family protein [Fusibacter ferrireducens]MBF4693438.1 TldD/PmbA family protein [Fusibacter ferrireducens]